MHYKKGPYPTESEVDPDLINAGAYSKPIRKHYTYKVVESLWLDMLSSNQSFLGKSFLAFTLRTSLCLCYLGKEVVTVVPGAAFFSSDESFAMIRG